MGKRVFLIVLDSLGVGALPDAHGFGDEGSHTLQAICAHKNFHAPTLTSLGLFHIHGAGTPPDTPPLAAFARMNERSAAKDTTVGHWEIAGCVSQKAFPVYPNGFPDEIMQAFEQACRRPVLCNRPYSGTQVIRDFGEEQRARGGLIVYTSADSVFQVAAHEDSVSTEELYRCCRIARELLQGEHAVGRVIARPFTGEFPFVRTPRRHDFSIAPPKDTLLDRLSDNGYAVIGVGKIGDIFAGKGLTESHPTENNRQGMALTRTCMERDFEGLCFVNLVDFDMLYGHRNDVGGYAAAVSEFDAWLGEALHALRKEDILIITADHGCDPSTPSTDHSREYTPLLVYGAPVTDGIDLGTRDSFSDICATVLSYFSVPQNGTDGVSFLKDICKNKKKFCKNA